MLAQMQEAVRQIKANYRDQIHCLRWQEKNDIANQINITFDKLFPVNSQFRFNNLWDIHTYTVVELDNYYIYYINSEQENIPSNRNRLRKDKAIFLIAPIGD